MPAIADGRLFVSRFAPPNYENQREQRLTTAFDRESPKLAEWKAAGAVSILILENGGLADIHAELKEFQWAAVSTQFGAISVPVQMRAGNLCGELKAAMERTSGKKLRG